MRREVLIALGLAAISGVFAATGISSWLSSEHRRLLSSHQAPPAVETTTVVVAKEELKFGTPVTKEKLELADWPVKNVPQGSFKSIPEFLVRDLTRVVLEPIQANEPILAGKVTGPGQRSGLATMLQRGKKAVTIRINDVVGVGGLVLPGDRVDIFVTNDNKAAPKNKDGTEAQAYTDLLLQNVRVLAVDQVLDPKHTEPILGRTVTVEASLAEAQKITLASSIGNLTLVLRETAVAEVPEIWNRLTVADLSGNSGEKVPEAALEPTNAVAPEPQPVAPVVAEERKDLAKVNVVRATAETEYSVLKSAAGK